MPKMKGHKGAMKRVKVTRKGKVVAGKCGGRHLLSSKNRKRKRRLSGTGVINPEAGRRICEMLGLR